MTAVISAERPSADRVLSDIADYVTRFQINSEDAYRTARLSLLDSLGCALAALAYPACAEMLGPVVPGATLAGGARVPGTSWELDPVQAAFNCGAAIRWLDYNDTWLAAEWGHPSDNLGGILAAADWFSRRRLAAGQPPMRVRELLTAMINAYEIQGVIALENAFNRVGLDHVILVRVATAAVVAGLLGGTPEQIQSAVSHAWLDGGALRTYRHAPNVGPRKSWAAGDATSRGVRLALWALAGQAGCPSTLTAPTWGFYDALFRGQAFCIPRPFGSYVMERVLFKVAYPAEFHAQTAVEAALRLHPQVCGRLDQVARVRLQTQESVLRIIHKTGPLANSADRDHCLEYMVAVALIEGNLTAEHYQDAAAADPRIDRLREKTTCEENPAYSRDYLDPEKRSIANAVQVSFADGSETERVEVEYPLGHRRRRAESMPLLRRKLEANLAGRLSDMQCRAVLELWDDPARLESMSIPEFVALFVVADRSMPAK